MLTLPDLHLQTHILVQGCNLGKGRKVVDGFYPPGSGFQFHKSGTFLLVLHSSSCPHQMVVSNKLKKSVEALAINK